LAGITFENEKGLAGEQSVFADFFSSKQGLFCPWQHPFSPVAWSFR
jgi:hypothetical protein